jgi:hypothetical protein
MRRPRHHETYDPVIVSRQVSRHVSQHRDPFDEPETVAEPQPAFAPEPSFEPDPAPVAFQQSTPASAAHAAEVISLEAMRSVAPNYEEDLDVPAFLRKRSEVM